jgi:hypothetical protein
MAINQRYDVSNTKSIDIKRQKKLEQLKKLVVELDEEFDLKKEEFEKVYHDVIEKKELINPSIPLSAFSSEHLGSLETITKFLREEYGFTFRRIAQLLGRNIGPIGVTYRNSLKKQPKKLRIKVQVEGANEIRIPVEIFNNSRFSILETIVSFLSSRGMNYSQIGRMIKRDPRTIWTVHRRYQKKIKGVAAK